MIVVISWHLKSEFVNKLRAILIIYFSGYHMIIHHIIWCTSIPLWVYNCCFWQSWYSLLYKKGLVHLENLLKRRKRGNFFQTRGWEKREVPLEMKEGEAIQNRILYSSFDDGLSIVFRVYFNILTVFARKKYKKLHVM